MMDDVSSSERCVMFEQSRWIGRGIICKADGQAVPVSC
jgi:hypothetical protein